MPYVFMTPVEILTQVVDNLGKEFLVHDNDDDLETGFNFLETEGFTVVHVEYGRDGHVVKVLFHRSYDSIDRAKAER